MFFRLKLLLLLLFWGDIGHLHLGRSDARAKCISQVPQSKVAMSEKRAENNSPRLLRRCSGSKQLYSMYAECRAYSVMYIIRWRPLLWPGRLNGCMIRCTQCSATSPYVLGVTCLDLHRSLPLLTANNAVPQRVPSRASSGGRFNAPSKKESVQQNNILSAFE